MERKYEIGQQIEYVDEHGEPHAALVTQWWGPGPGRVVDYQPDPTGEPGCNLVYVSGDEKKRDECGRQLERATSVVHQSMQPAHGRFWRWSSK